MRQARRICASGLAESVIHGDLTVTDALKSIKAARSASLPDPKVREYVTSPETQSINSDAEHSHEECGDHPDTGLARKIADAQQMDGLALENARLRSQVHLLGQENAQLKAEVRNLREEQRRSTGLPRVLDDEAFRTQITQLEKRLHSQEGRLKRERERADAAENELAHLRRQPLFVD